MSGAAFCADQAIVGNRAVAQFYVGEERSSNISTN